MRQHIQEGGMKKNCFKLILAIIVLAFCFSVLPVLAAEKNTESGSKEKSCYRLIPQEFYSVSPVNPASPDNKHPVCKVVLDNLNKFCDEPPMVCAFKIHPKYSTQLSAPKWTQLDINKNLDKIEAMIRTPYEIQADTANNKKFQDESWEIYYKSLKKGLDDGSAKLEQTHFDLRNLGRAYDVLRVSNGICTGKTIILDQNDDPKVAAREYEQSTITVEYTSEELRKIFKPSMIYTLWEYNIFFFHGVTFTYSWIGDNYGFLNRIEMRMAIFKGKIFATMNILIVK